MSNSKFKNKLHNEIESRNSSLDWSGSIAESVKRERDGKIKRNASIGSSLVVIFIVSFVLSFDYFFKKDVPSELYSKFVQEQIQGTYTLSVNPKKVKPENIQIVMQQDIVFSNSIDETISSAIAKR